MTLDKTLIQELDARPLPRVALAARSSRGMTLIEILVVLTIIGLIMGGIVVYAAGALDDSKPKAAAKDIANMKTAVEMYKIRKNKCPKTAQDLKAGGVLERVSKDPWGNDYDIKCPGEHGAIDISSAGPDGQLGNEDDVNSWDEAVGQSEDKD